jgi:hypothetical protein
MTPLTAARRSYVTPHGHAARLLLDRIGTKIPSPIATAR